MKLNIKLSVIIPHYNSAKSVEKLLLSIPKIASIQVIIVDDRSSPEEYKALQLLEKKSRFELYLNNENKGAGASRNLGLSKAIGKWVLFADSDDFFMPDMWDKIEPYLSTDFDIVFFTPYSVYISTDQPAERHTILKHRLKKYLEHKTRSNELDLRYKFFPPWSKLISRQLIIENKIFFDEIIASNDVLFSNKVGLAIQKFEVSEDIIYVVTRGEESLTATFNKDVLNSRTDAFVRRFDFLKTNLSKSDFDMLSVSGLSTLISVYSAYGYRAFLKTIKAFRKHRIPLFTFRDINFKVIFFKFKRAAKK